MSWLSVNINLPKFRKRATAAPTLAVSTSEAVANAKYQTGTTMKIDHLAKAVLDLKDAMEKGFASAKADRKELKDSVARMEVRLDTRDSHLETRIDNCRATKQSN